MEQENSSEVQKKEAQRLYDELMSKITRLCEEADEELANMQRKGGNHNEEPA
jgi:hypothetical protein